jgi:hypothetical protein
MESAGKKGYLIDADFLFGFYSYSENGVDVFLRSVGSFQQTARCCPRRFNSS